MGIRSGIQRIIGKNLSQSSKNELEMFLFHPVTWMKGDYLDEGIVHPWEKLLYGIHGFLNNATGAWNGQDRLFRYTYHVDPRHITISSTIQNVWDFINDPLIGSWMDRHPMQTKTYRTLIRISHVVGTILSFFVLLDLNLSPLQHIIVWSARNMFCDILGTFAGVSSTKYFASITPYSDERGKINVWKNVGIQMGYPIANIPGWLFGLVSEQARRTTFTDYNVYVWGFLIIMPLTILGGIIYTFAKNRVQFTPDKKEAEGQDKEKQLSFRESITVLRHNKYLLLNSVAAILTTLTPKSDAYPIWRFLVPGLKLGKNKDGSDRILRGEALPMIISQISGIPITFLYPFLRQITKLLGGPRRTQMTLSVAQMVVGLGKFGFGYKGWPAIIAYTLFDTVNQTLDPVGGYAGEILNYEMLDYVEYKTGYRSEGITAAFNGLKDKFAVKNLESLTQNEFLRWTGIDKIDFNAENVQLPARYTKWAWMLFTLAPVVDGLIWFIARALFKYDPAQKDVIEAELKERRALMQAATAEEDAEG